MIQESAEVERPCPMWQVDARYGGHLITCYLGNDFQRVCKRIGEMVMSAEIKRLVVYRNGAPYRWIDVCM